MDWRTYPDTTYISAGRGHMILEGGSKLDFSGPHLICKFCGRWLASKTQTIAALNGPQPIRPLVSYICNKEECVTLGSIEGTYNPEYV